ncbi:hypothetical protein MP228_010706 [Amoeboaphelidium protococcarum]|nr:hypothetical protein MP228_010706 [Amoeboaphelidium protococcarum]
MSNITQRDNFKVLIIGAFLLSSNAGYIGALSIAGLHNCTVAHISGDMIKSAIYVALEDWFYAARISMVWLSFMAGSAVSAMIVSGTKTFDLRRTYGWALLIESGLLFISYLVADNQVKLNNWWWSEYFAAMACGLQNALCTTYSGAVLRTTHMTGCATDFGIVLGQEVRMRVIIPLRQRLNANGYRRIQAVSQPDAETSILWKLKFLVPLMAGYLFGALVGTLCYVHFKQHALVGPFVFTGCIGLFFAVWTTLRKVGLQVQALGSDIGHKVTLLLHSHDHDAAHQPSDSVSDNVQLNDVSRTSQIQN